MYIISLTSSQLTEQYKWLVTLMVYDNIDIKQLVISLSMELLLVSTGSNGTGNRVRVRLTSASAQVHTFVPVTTLL